MNFVVTINNRKYILTPDRLHALVCALDGAEQVDNKWVGKSTGNSNGYITILATTPLSETLAVTVLTDDEYNTLKLVTASQPSA